MPLFQEIDITTYSGGQIIAIEPDSVADDIGLQINDELLAINDQKVEDVIDVQFYSAEETFELLIRRGEEYLLYEAKRNYNQTLGLEFAHPTFDTDIRRCTNLCGFCFVLQMAPKFRRTLYIKDDDYRYSFLFGHFVTLTNLSEHDWWRIEAMHLSPLYVSVHVTDLELRRRFLRNNTAPDVLEQLRWLAEKGIEVHTQLVIVPEFNDGQWLERSIQELEALWPTVQSISVVPVGLTKQHKYKMRTHTQEEATEILQFVESLQARYLEKFGIRFVYPTDEWFLISDRDVPEMAWYDGQQLQENGLGSVRFFLDEWEEEKKEIANWKAGEKQELNYTAVTLTTGLMFAPTLTKTAKEFSQLTNISLDVLPIQNERLGGTITAAGLLIGADMLTQLEAVEYNKLVILPRVMFDHPDTITLDDLSPQDVANRLNCTIALADTMGDVWDAIIGQSQVVYTPESATPDSIPLRFLNESDLDSNNHLS